MRAMTLLSAVGSVLLLAAQPALSQENAAEKAVEAAKQYSGVTPNTAEEAGLLATTAMMIAMTVMSLKGLLLRGHFAGSPGRHAASMGDEAALQARRAGAQAER